MKDEGAASWGSFSLLEASLQERKADAVSCGINVMAESQPAES